MSPLPSNWYFGSKTRSEDQQNPYGGFNLGNPPPVQSSVATPNPASAGVSGQPPMSNGGMGVGQRNEQEDPGGTSVTAESNANVTGFNPTLAGMGLSAATMMAGIPGAGALLGLTGVPALGANVLGTIARNTAASSGLGAFDSNMVDVNGNPVTYSGPNTITGSLLGALRGDTNGFRS
jgi:hypothetical protein